MEHKGALRIFDSLLVGQDYTSQTTCNKIKDASHKFQTWKPIVGRFPSTPNLKLYIRPAVPFSTQFDFNFNQELRFLSAFNFHLNVILRKTMFKPQFLMNVNVYESYSLTDF